MLRGNAIFDFLHPSAVIMPKKSERFTAEGSQKSKMCFPCSVGSTFFLLPMQHGKHIFAIDLTPTVKMTFLKGGVKVGHKSHHMIIDVPCMEPYVAPVAPIRPHMAPLCIFTNKWHYYQKWYHLWEHTWYSYMPPYATKYGCMYTVCYHVVPYGTIMVP